MYHIEIIFGHNRFDGEPLAEAEIEAAQLIGLAILSEFFEGGNVDDRVGAYKSSNGLMFEPCSVLMADAANIDEACIEQLETLARAIAKFLHQQSVLLKVQQFEGMLRSFGQFDDQLREMEQPAA